MLANSTPLLLFDICCSLSNWRIELFDLRIWKAMTKSIQESDHFSIPCETFDSHWEKYMLGSLDTTSGNIVN